MTQADAQAQLDAWEAASLALASSQSYSIGGRTLTRADGQEIRAQLGYWRRAVMSFQAKSSGARTGQVSIAVLPS